MTAPSAAVRYHFGHFELQPDERRLLAMEAPVHLGAHAFDVLVALVERSGYLVGKEDLLRRVWGRVVVAENTLQVHISTLRKVLGPQAIATVSGRGYRFTLDVTRSSAAATATAEAPTNNLPHELTSFIGRDKELAALTDLLAKVRLLTLTGAGGCGKTRLAIELARRCAQAYAHGVWLVELASLADAALLPQTVGNVLRVKEIPGAPVVDTLAQYLAQRVLLLVLDNAEHLIDACAQLAESLLRRCPGLVVLVTSRERLAITGEQSYRVPSLSVPDAQSHAIPEAIEAYESARLFIDRARLQRPDFTVTKHNSSAIASICRRLDGIALALELAAPCVRTLSIDELSRRLDRRFEVLTEGSRTALPRHRTLRAMIDWSHDLLTDSEKMMLRRVSVFSGGWTLEAAAFVCAGGRLGVDEAPDLLASLAVKNLIVAENGDNAVRYDTLETVREYAREQLRNCGEHIRTHRQHLAFLLALTEEARTKNMGSSHDWLHRFDAELGNMRTALSWACSPEGDATGGLRLAGALDWLWLVRGYFSEGRRWLRRLLALVPDGAEDAVRAKAILVASDLARRQDDDAEAESLATQALALCTNLDDHPGIVMALQVLGHAEKDRGNFSSARDLLERGLGINRQMGDEAATASMLVHLASVALAASDLPDARARLDESIAISRKIGDWRVAYSLAMAGHGSFFEHDYRLAKARLTEALQIQREVGIRVGVASSLTTLAIIAHDEGDDDHAVIALREALTIVRDVGSPGHLCENLEAFAVVAGRIRSPEAAAHIWGAAERLREDARSSMIAVRRRWYDEQVAVTRAKSLDGVFEAAWNEGRAMTEEQVVAYALCVEAD